MFQRILQNVSKSERTFVGRVEKPTPDFIRHASMQKRHSPSKLKFIPSFILLQTQTKCIGMRIYILIGRLVAQTILHGEISQLFDAIIPSHSKLVVPLVDLSLHRPLQIEHHSVVPQKRRSVAYICTKRASSVTVDVLLDVAEKWTFALSLHKNAGIVVWVPDFFVSLLEQEQIHLMSQFCLLQPLLILGLDYVFETVFFLQQQSVQIFKLPFVVLLNVACFFLGLSPKVHLDIFVKSRLGHLVENTLQFGHGILETGVLERDGLVFALDVYLGEALRVVKGLYCSLNRVHRI